MSNTVDPQELIKFNQHAAQWWDEQGPLWTLHAINPLRTQFILQQTELADKQVLDVGCGGGILSERLAQLGARVTAIDLAADAITAAQTHCQLANLTIDYKVQDITQLAAEQPAHFDIITCMEMLEHVPDPAAIIEACSQALKPGGLLFVSTLNRNLKSFLHAIIGAEYILSLLPRGTHHYNKFLKPAEINTWAREHQLELQAMRGIDYQPLSKKFELTSNVSVNYLMMFRKKY